MEVQANIFSKTKLRGQGFTLFEGLLLRVRWAIAVICTVLHHGADDVVMMCTNSQRQRAKHQSREAPIRVCAEIQGGGGGANPHRLRSRSLSGPAVAQGAPSYHQ